MRHAQKRHPRPAIAPALIGFAATAAAIILLVPSRGDGPRSVAAAAAAPAAGDAQGGGTQTADEVGSGHAAHLQADAAAASEAAPPHVRYDPALPPVGPGTVHTYRIGLVDRTFRIAPGVSYTGWTFEGSAPGPVIHVRQGDTVRVTLTNKGAIPHSIDFHAARIAPDQAFRSVDPGRSITFSFTAGDAGAFMYHCGTPPVLAHIANGMYGAIIVDPATPLPPADRSYVLVSSEWYLSGDGKRAPATLDYQKARHMQPDYVTFNGYANQYKDAPLTANVGDRVRFYVVDAGPSLDTDFHVVGSLLDRVYPGGNPSQAVDDVQTWGIPAGGGAVFDTHFPERGLYPVVSHSFASVDMGELAVLNVGGVKGTMAH